VQGGLGFGVWHSCNMPQLAWYDKWWLVALRQFKTFIDASYQTSTFIDVSYHTKTFIDASYQTKTCIDASYQTKTLIDVSFHTKIFIVSSHHTKTLDLYYLLPSFLHSNSIYLQNWSWEKTRCFRFQNLIWRFDISRGRGHGPGTHANRFGVFFGQSPRNITHRPSIVTQHLQLIPHKP